MKKETWTYKKNIYQDLKQLTKKEKAIYIAGAFFGIDELVENMGGSAGNTAYFIANYAVKYYIIKNLWKT